MSKLIQILIVVLLTLSLNSFAQIDLCCTQTINDAVKENSSAIISATLYINEHPSKKEQFYDDWSTGEIIFSNGTTANNCKIRYNIWKDELIWLRETDFKKGIVIKQSISEFYLHTNTPNEKHFVKYFEQEGLTNQYVYLEVLAQGKISFFSNIKASYNKSSDNFNPKQQYYIMINQQIQKIKLNKKSILELLSIDDQEKLKNILQTHHLKIKRMHDLAMAINILNKNKR